MDVREAVAKAKEHFETAFGGEYIAGPRLEEVWLDRTSDTWFVTLGIVRKSEGFNKLAGIGLVMRAEYKDGDFQYKTVEIDKASGEVLSIKSRELIPDVA